MMSLINSHSYRGSLVGWWGRRYAFFTAGRYCMIGDYIGFSCSGRIRKKFTEDFNPVKLIMKFYGLCIDPQEMR